MDNEYDGAGYVMRYIHIVAVTAEIVEAAGFTLNDWDTNNIPRGWYTKPGVKVKKGDMLGYSGGKRGVRKFGGSDTSGEHSTGAHLHLELLEFKGDDFNKAKIKDCVRCSKGNFKTKGLTATPKDFSLFLSDGTVFANKKKQKQHE